ncbi:hypothetical protein HBN50_03990 [Halobacteriovorax sp. GB3]|uniref:hypothetical protein n=1 Tax=Halobacteriovorax sp. GB3 TaxID=2719615 RepID=UPI00235F178B|nr:hypothetical protein [Halobacteriovorax sp. GB3]MDD0852241.1 hypothetical protein [Halobacteriovorax sp. GB3]
MKKLILTSLFLSFYAFASDAPMKLDTSELKMLRDNHQVIKELKSPKGAWPVVRLYQVIDASPLEATAIFFALDYQKDYVPNLVRSDIAKVVSPTEVWVEYEMDMPWPLSNSVYLHGHKLKKKAKDHYRIDWWMESSNTTELVKGHAEFLPFDQGKTLMLYQNYVIPKSILASFIKGTMIKDVQKSLSAIKDHIVYCKNKKKELLKKYKGFILDSLNGKSVYTLNKRK